jgi:putative tricarboxylic transport membrane protein
MDGLHGLLLGLSITLSLHNIILCLIGSLLGMVIGVLPGLGPAATMALLLPITYRLDVVGSLIMLSGVYYGAMYGGSITSILVKIPGEAASVITCIDGYAMAKKGRAGAALGLSAIGSFIAGIFATLGIALLGPQVASIAFQFGPAEYASLVLVGLLMSTWISQMSTIRSLFMMMIGLILATIGLDPIWGDSRYTFGIPQLYDGVSMPVMAMGLFGIAEVFLVVERHQSFGDLLKADYSLRNLFPNRSEWKLAMPAIGRGSILGFVLGVLPGSGAVLAAFASYVIERKISKDPSSFGKGAPAGVSGPESANNAAAQSSFIPLLCMGIPANVVMAIMMGALLIQGITPGPGLIHDRPDLFWGVIASMLLGNVLLIILNLPLISLFVNMLRIPFSFMGPAILLFCIVGAYSINSNMMDIYALLIFGSIGYFLRKIRLDPAPLILAFVLGDIFEKSFRQALIMNFGSPSIFIHRPISAFFLMIAILLIFVQFYGFIKSMKKSIHR